MDVVIITYALIEMTDERHREVAAELAPAFAELPGLRGKIWLTDPDTNTYGGVYLFADSAAADGFLGSALFRTVGSYPHFRDVTAHRFAVNEEATRRTQLGLNVLGDVLTRT